jgi:hypothetical protein
MSIENADAVPRLGDATVHQRLPEHDLMNTLVGKWITARETIPGDGTPHSRLSRATSMNGSQADSSWRTRRTVASANRASVGWRSSVTTPTRRSTRYKTYFFDSQGNVTVEDLSYNDGTWAWSGQNTRATGVLSDDGNTIPKLHEWSDDGVNWRPSMDVTLRKVV